MKSLANISLGIYRLLGREIRYRHWTEREGSLSVERISSTRLPAWYYYHYLHEPMYLSLYRRNGNKNLW
jgi:hypothetical protein